MRTSYTRLFILLLSAFFLFTYDQHAAAQSGRQQQQQKATPRPAADEESESDDKDDKDDADENEAARPRATDAAAVMRAARTVYVNSKSVFVKQSEVEDSLRKRKEFRAWGMAVTRNLNDADLVIEIERKSLTRRFTFVVLEPRTMTVVTSGKTRSVLFGKKIPNKIAEKFANRVKVVRPYPPVASNP
jgi:hypothetical protein